MEGGGGEDYGRVHAMIEGCYLILVDFDNVQGILRGHISL